MSSEVVQCQQRHKDGLTQYCDYQYRGCMCIYLQESLCLDIYRMLKKQLSAVDSKYDWQPIN